jgi:hypothetical protein
MSLLFYFVRRLPLPPAEIPAYLPLPSLSALPAHSVEYEQKRRLFSQMFSEMFSEMFSDVVLSTHLPGYALARIRRILAATRETFSAGTMPGGKMT